jgi:ankyrin repeat protein
MRFTLILLGAMIFNQCESQNSSSQPTGYDIAIFKNTEGYELARAIEQNSVRKIKKILEQKPDLINFQEPVYGQSVLKWAVRMEKYEAARTLLESGANPDQQSFNGWSPMTEAASNLFTSQYLELLIEFGADVNAVSVETTYKNPFINSWTPLMFAIDNFENVKLLINNGADVNYLHDLKKNQMEHGISIPN